MATTHPDYNTQRFPVLVCHHGMWDVFRNDSGYCAAIPTEAGEKAGCRPSHFGDMTYVRQVLARELLEFQAEQAVAVALALATPLETAASVA